MASTSSLLSGLVQPIVASIRKGDIDILLPSQEESLVEQNLAGLVDLSSMEESVQDMIDKGVVRLLARVMSETERSRTKELCISCLANMSCFQAGSSVSEDADIRQLVTFIFKNEIDSQVLSQTFRLFQTVFTIHSSTLPTWVSEFLENKILSHAIFILQNTLTYELFLKSVESLPTLIWACHKRVQLPSDDPWCFISQKEGSELLSFVVNKLWTPKSKLGKGFDIDWTLTKWLVKLLGTIAMLGSEWAELLVPHYPKLMRIFTAAWPSISRDSDLSDLNSYWIRVFNTLCSDPEFTKQLNDFTLYLDSDPQSLHSLLYTALSSSQFTLVNYLLLYHLLPPSIPSKSQPNKESILTVKKSIQQFKRDSEVELEELLSVLDEKVRDSVAEFFENGN